MSEDVKAILISELRYHLIHRERTGGSNQNEPLPLGQPSLSVGFALWIRKTAGNSQYVIQKTFAVFSCFQL